MAKKKKKRKTRKNIKKTRRKLKKIKSKKTRSKIYKTRKKIITDTKEELIIKTTKAWAKKSYANKKTYEKKYGLSIKNNEGFWRKEG